MHTGNDLGGVDEARERQEVEAEPRDATDGVGNDEGGVERGTSSGAKAAMLRMRNRGLLEAFAKWMGLWEEVRRARLYVLDAYEQMCRSQNMPALGLTVVKRLLSGPRYYAIRELDFSGINWGPAGARAFGNVMRGVALNGEPLESPSLVRIREYCGCPDFEAVRCSGCRLSSEGIKDVVGMLADCRVALSIFVVSANALGPSGADSLVRLLQCQYCPLQQLVADDNALGDAGIAAIATAALAATTLGQLSLRKNHASAAAGAALGKLLHGSTTLTELDLGGNDLHGEGAAEFAKGLRANQTLIKLNISRNGFGSQKAMKMLSRAIVNCSLQDLELSDNHIGDGSALIFAEAVKVNHHLRTIILDGNPIQLKAARELLKYIGFSENGMFTRVISMKNCLFQIVVPCLIDPNDPAGFYSLHMGEEYSKPVMEFLINLQLKGEFEFDRGEVIYFSELAEHKLKQSKEVVLMTFSADCSTWSLPTTGLLEFRFIDKRAHAVEKAEAAKAVVDIFRQYSSRQQLGYKHLTSSGDSGMKRRNDAAETHSFYIFDQIVERLSSLPKTDSEARIEFLSSSLPHFLEAGDNRILPLLVHEEKLRIKNTLSLKSIDSIISFSNGHYIIDLSIISMRNVAARLQTLKKGFEREEADALESLRKKGMPSVDLDVVNLVWRNLNLDDAQIKYSKLWLLPHQGILQLDFVDIRKPDPEEKAMNEDEFKILIMDKWQSTSRLLKLALMQPAKKLALLQELALSKYFSCLQIFQMISHFSPAEHSQIRIEIYTICWSRTIDWHGLRHVLDTMTPRERREVQYRIGALSLYDEMMAVGNYELDLGCADERFLFRELLKLANIEPGSRMLHLTLDGNAWDVSSQLRLSEIPSNGITMFFFVRAPEVLEVVQQQGAYHHSRHQPSPSSLSQFCCDWLKPFCVSGSILLSGTDWILPWLCRNIILKLRQKYESADQILEELEIFDPQAFYFDEFLARVATRGIWFYPQELNTLHEVLAPLDNGAVRTGEFQSFWQDNLK